MSEGSFTDGYSSLRDHSLMIMLYLDIYIIDIK